MNKRGFTVIYAFMLGVLLFCLGFALAPALKDVVHQTMSDPLLSCDSPDISNYMKGVCTQIDYFTPLFFGLILGLAGVILGGMAL